MMDLGLILPGLSEGTAPSSVFAPSSRLRHLRVCAIFAFAPSSRLRHLQHPRHLHLQHFFPLPRHDLFQSLFLGYAFYGR
jgi:hypothetical protein